MILVLEDRYESPLSIDTKKVPVALHLTSQWRFNDVRVTKNWILRILDENRPNFNFSPKILGICDFDGVFGQLWKEMTIITYTESFKYKAPIFLY